MSSSLALPRNYGCRIETDWTIKGVRAVVIENEILRVTILSGKGGDVYEFLHKPTDTDFMLKTAKGLPQSDSIVHGMDIQYTHNALYHGGWQDVFPHGSSPAPVNGVPHYQHGEVLSTPFDVNVVTDTPDEVAVTLRAVLRLTPIRVEKTYRLKRNSPVMDIDETVVNLGRAPIDAIWGQHPAFGPAFLNPDCKIFAPIQTMSLTPMGEEQPNWPNWKTKEGSVADYSAFPPIDGNGTNGMVYGKTISDGWYALVDTKKGVGFGMTWDKELFPIIWMYRSFGKLVNGVPDAFGIEYMIAIEPFSSFPQARENNLRLLRLEPNKPLSTTIRALAISGKKSVSGISRDGTVR